MNRLLAFTLLAFSLTACAADPEPAETEERFFNSGLTIERQFNPAQLDTPEAVATDWDGNVYVTSGLNGLLYKRDSDENWSVLTALPIGEPLVPCGPFPGIVGGITVDWDRTLYVNVASCIPENRGVWAVDPDTGAGELIAPLGFDVLPNGIARFAGDLYIADSLGAVWKVPMEGGVPELWAEGPLFDQSGLLIEGVPVPGPNGIQFYGTDAYIANSSQGTIIRVPVKWDGSAGTPEVYHEFENPEEGCDDFAFDTFGRIYCTTDPFQTVVRVDRDGSEHVIFDGNEGDFLDGPTAVAFGRGQNRFTMYVTSASFPFFLPLSTGNGPALVSSTTIPGGYPFR